MTTGGVVVAGGVMTEGVVVAVGSGMISDVVVACPVRGKLLEAVVSSNGVGSVTMTALVLVDVSVPSKAV